MNGALKQVVTFRFIKMADVGREKNRLAVFEQLVGKVEAEEPNLSKCVFKRSYSPASDDGLVIDDEDEIIVVRNFIMVL